MQIQQDLARFTSDALYLDEHRDELLKKYPDRWVAVYDGKVVGTAKEMTTLVRKLERKGISAAHAYTQYLTEDERDLILFVLR